MPCNLCFGSTEPSKLVTLVTSARYLGAHVNDTGSSAEHIKNRLSKATAAAKLLGAFFRNQCISPSFRLLVHQSVVQSILLFTIESIVPTRAELVRLDSVHFRILRQIFGIKSSFFHRVLQDDFEPCSNEYLQQLANSQGRHIYTPSQLASTRRLQLLGHILRHQDSLEYHCCFTASHSCRTARSDSAIRRGRPRPHWAELTFTEAFRRSSFVASPSPVDLSSDFFQYPSATEVSQAHGGCLASWSNNTPLYRTVNVRANNRSQWRVITGKLPPSRKNHSGPTSIFFLSSLSQSIVSIDFCWVFNSLLHWAEHKQAGADGSNVALSLHKKKLPTFVAFSIPRFTMWI